MTVPGYVAYFFLAELLFFALLFELLLFELDELFFAPLELDLVGITLSRDNRASTGKPTSSS